MKSLRRVSVVVTLCLILVVPFARASDPPPSGEEADARAAPKLKQADGMTAWSVDSGGGESSGGDFSVTAAIGQPDAGLISQCGTVLAGGLWAGAVDLQPLFCNGFESGGTDVWSSAVGGTL